MKVSGLLLACVALLPLHALGKDSEEEHGVLRGTQAATGPTESLSIESRNVTTSLSLMAQEEDAADRDLQAVVKPCRRPRYCRDVRPNLPTAFSPCPPWESCSESCWISHAEIVIPRDYYTKINDNASVRVVGSAMQTCKTSQGEFKHSFVPEHLLTWVDSNGKWLGSGRDTYLYAWSMSYGVNNVWLEAVDDNGYASYSTNYKRIEVDGSDPVTACTKPLAITRPL